MNPGPLLSHEWLVVALFSFSIIFLTVFSQWSASQARFTFKEVSKPLVVLHITGEVESPGLYNIEKGKTIRDAFDRAGVKPSADLAKYDLDELVEAPRKFVIKAKREKRTKKRE